MYDGDYMQWDKFVNEFTDDVDQEIDGNVWFDKYSANFESSFSESDVELFRTYIGDSINLRVYAIVAGSTKQGPENALTDLVYGDFTVHFVADDVVTACKNNELINMSVDYDDNIRSSPVVYETAPLGEDAEEIEIQAYQIVQTQTSCIMTTVFEYWNPTRWCYD
jgi:hypothetical protein